MTTRKTSNTTRLNRAFVGISVLAGLLFAFALPAFAQSDAGSIPENAHESRFGDGWECDLGYRANDTSCELIALPDNAYATGRSYGRGWDCHRGFEVANDSYCSEIPVPENAFLRSSSYGWQCERGYQRGANSCVAIVLPDHAYLTEDYTDSGWSCERGYVADKTGCVEIVVPENGYLTNARYGETWACERGFIEVAGRCDAIAVPANAFLDANSYGPGWRCERGYAPAGNACIKIELPVHAHLDLTGNRWSCDMGFQLTDGQCLVQQ